MATPRSKLLSVVEYFWNQYWCYDSRIKLIICGSSASWIIKKIINNKGGLHNRITKKIQLRSFNLAETKAYLAEHGIKLNHYQIAQLYMVTGGVPYYLSQMKKGLSSSQQIEQLAFKEFDNLFSSLFKNVTVYIELIKIISENHEGISQEEIIEKSKNMSRGGRANEKLKELEDAGFILSFCPFQHKKRGIYFRLIDEYTLFYLKWIEPIRKTLQKESLEPGFWERIHDSSSWRSWSGYAFESLCYKHISQIRKKLGISPSAIAHTWRVTPKKGKKEEGTQIDLLFDRRDNCITLCEIKFCEKPFLIDKAYSKQLEKKKAIFIEKTATNKHVMMAMIVANGMKHNAYSDDLISQIVTLDDLF